MSTQALAAGGVCGYNKAMEKREKTNVMRFLDAKKIAHECYFFDCETAPSGEEVAAFLHKDPAQVFKTLVTAGKSGAHYVFMVPVTGELDLKKAAAAAGEKNVEMIKSKDLLPLTGYVHGGCSPIGMKKYFPTFIHSSAKDLPTVIFSAGKIGRQVELAPADLFKAVRIFYADLT